MKSPDALPALPALPAPGPSSPPDELAARRPSSIIEAKIRSEIRRDLEMMVMYAAKLGFSQAK